MEQYVSTDQYTPTDLYAPSSPSYSHESVPVVEPYVPQKKQVTFMDLEPYVPQPLKKKTPEKVTPQRFKPYSTKDWVNRQHHLVKWASVLADRIFNENRFSSKEYERWESELVNAIRTHGLSTDRERVLNDLDPSFLSRLYEKMNQK